MDKGQSVYKYYIWVFANQIDTMIRHYCICLVDVRLCVCASLCFCVCVHTPRGLLRLAPPDYIETAYIQNTFQWLT